MDAKTMQKVINGMADKIELLWDTVEFQVKESNDVTKDYGDKIDDLSKYCQDNKDKIIKLVDKTDDLEAKNYQLRGELDGVYKVLEMDACDIQKIQDKMEGK